MYLYLLCLPPTHRKHLKLRIKEHSTKTINNRGETSIARLNRIPSFVSQPSEFEGESSLGGLMDDTLIIVSLEPMRMVSKLQSQVTESTREVGSPQCARKESGSLTGSFTVSVHVSVICQHSPSGTCRAQILTTVQTFLQRCSLSPCRLRRRDQQQDTMIKLQSARCCGVQLSHHAESGFRNVDAIPCFSAQVLPPVSRPVAHLWIYSSHISLWQRPNSQPSP